ncbi:MAG: hypothetical protein HQ559_16380 [Lentisphaerae bacterium]|nr:hypothetical protein [Lentisphaerota bacterium]
MKSRLLLALLSLAAGCRTPARRSGSIPATQFNGWTNAVRLASSNIEVVIVPAVGRIVSIRTPDGSNLLRLDPAKAGVEIPEDAEKTWFNIGGDWLWPAAQASWKAESWKEPDGRQCCRLTREFGDPLDVTVSREISIEKDGARITILQKAERVGKGGGFRIRKGDPLPFSAPVTLWNISQVIGADRAFLPADEDSTFEGGVKVLMGERPGKDLLMRIDALNVYRAGVKGEHKLGSDSKRYWIAAEKDGVLLVERVVRNLPPVTHRTATAPPLVYPDGGCRLEMYSNTGLGYTEIGTLSPEVRLLPGQQLENTLAIELHPFPKGLSDTEAAKRVFTLVEHSPYVPGVPHHR